MMPYSPEQIEEIRTRWVTGDPAEREGIFQELAGILAQSIPGEQPRLTLVYPGGSTPISDIAEKNKERKRNEHLDSICRKFPTSDIGNSQRFAQRKKPVARFCHAYKSWFIWDGRRWGKDHIGKAIELAKEVILRIGDEAISIEYSDDSARIFRWAAASQARPRIDAALYLAQSVMAIEPKDLDAKGHLLNLPNGTFNLSTGELCPHNKDDFLTKLAGVEYQPEEECPLWQNHLNLIFNNDQEMINAFQQVCGYTLLQENPEQVLFILYGSGKNGKSKTLGVLSHILGDYAINIAAETLMKKKSMNDNSPRGDVARIFNARFVSASEGEAGQPLAEGMVKQLTGDDKITVRRLYENEIEFLPTAKIWLATNHRPIIRGTDDGIWRRIWLIPFTVAIPEEKRDPDISKKLFAEGSGILNWMIKGLQKYQEAGHLVQPEKVKIATHEYRQDSDLLKEFLEGWCVMSGEIKRSDLYRAYSDWCEQNHEKAVGSKRFAIMIREHGVGERRDIKDRYWTGISSRGFWST